MEEWVKKDEEKRVIEEKKAEEERAKAEEEADIKKYRIMAENQPMVYTYEQRKRAEKWLSDRKLTWKVMPLPKSNYTRGNYNRGRGSNMGAGRGNRWQQEDNRNAQYPGHVIINAIENNNRNATGEGEGSGYGRGSIPNNNRGRYQRGNRRGNWSYDNSVGRGQRQDQENEWNEDQSYQNYPVSNNRRGRGGYQNQNENQIQNENRENSNGNGYQRGGPNQGGGYNRGNNRGNERAKIDMLQKDLNELKDQMGGTNQGYDEQRE